MTLLWVHERETSVIGFASRWVGVCQRKTLAGFMYFVCRQHLLTHWVARLLIYIKKDADDVFTELKRSKMHARGPDREVLDIY